MAFKQNKEESKEKSLNGHGPKKYSRMVRMYKEGYISVAIYKNVYEKKTYFDIVIYRKIRLPDGSNDFKRGANLKPEDLPILADLLDEANDYLAAVQPD